MTVRKHVWERLQGLIPVMPFKTSLSSFPSPVFLSPFPFLCYYSQCSLCSLQTSPPRILLSLCQSGLLFFSNAPPQISLRPASKASSPQQRKHPPLTAMEPSRKKKSPYPLFFPSLCGSPSKSPYLLSRPISIQSGRPMQPTWAWSEEQQKKK